MYCNCDYTYCNFLSINFLIKYAISSLFLYTQGRNCRWALLSGAQLSVGAFVGALLSGRFCLGAFDGSPYILYVRNKNTLFVKFYLKYKMN